MTAGLVLLGLGWSATTEVGSAALTDSVPADQRPAVQGTSNFLMNLAAAAGGVIAGVVLLWAGFVGLALGLLAPVVIVVANITRTERR